MVSRAQYRLASGAPTVTNLVVFAELAGHAKQPDRLTERLAAFRIDIVEMTREASCAAGAAFRHYRRLSGERRTILADFLIAGHAIALGAEFVTRDRRLASYFPDLTLITPETDHG